MSDFMKNYIYSFFALVFLIMAGCSKNEEPAQTNEKIVTSILLYAVASNNLSYSFYQDIDELKEGLKKCNLNSVEFYVYSVTHNNDAVPALSKAKIDSQGNVVFDIIKTYDREDESTSIKRISTVIEDYRDLTSATKHGLILWSHATAWAPAPKINKIVSADSRKGRSISHDMSGSLGNFGSVDPTEILWWGQDNYNGVSSYCDLSDLAKALPDNQFDFIWFDCCYMSSVEVIYELRNKAEMFVAYPTEVLAEGAPYAIITPYIASESPDLISAAQNMSQYYLNGNKVFTIAVIDPKAIENVAEIASQVAALKPMPASDLLKYSRGGYYFYDFTQFITSKENFNDIIDLKTFESAMNDLIIYKNCGNALFSGEQIDKNNFSGISTGYLDNLKDLSATSDSALIYYQTLEWFKRVYMPFIR